MRQVLLQSATGITKCDNFITKCGRYYKVRGLLQSATVHSLSRPARQFLKSFVRMKKMAFGDDRNVYRAPHGVMGSDCKGLGTKR